MEDIALSYAFNKMPLSSFQKENYFHLIKSGEEAFCFHTDDDEFNFMFSKIHYSKTIPEIPFDQAIQLRTAKPSDQMLFMFKYSFGVKYEEWQHESEYRIIVNANSIDHVGKAISVEKYVPFIKVSGLIMGEKFENKNLMLELCKKHELDLYQATLSDMEYKIIRKQILASGKEISAVPLPGRHFFPYLQETSYTLLKYQHDLSNQVQVRSDLFPKLLPDKSAWHRLKGKPGLQATYLNPMPVVFYCSF
ncbi:hypothetical protein [Legionella sp. 29fVS95]|uniref:hypothetical protein n=1 Tax=Legionella sp. 29fVS95 TaxID=3402813 RepID=UPI003AF9F229